MNLARRESRAALLVLSTLLFASGCHGSGHHNSASTTTTAPSASSSTAPGSATSSSVPASSLPTVPTPATSGPLTASGIVALGIASGTESPVAGEGPDGAVFVADPAGGDVLVVDSDLAPEVAEHIAGTVNSIAADTTNLYVATYTAAYQFDRISGTQVEQWALPPVNRSNTSDARLVSITVAGGYLWILETQGNDIDVYRVKPGSGASPGLVEHTRGAVVGPDGTLYFERSGGQLVRQPLSGPSAVGPTLATQPPPGGQAVPYLNSLAGGYLWTESDYGQGLDAGYQGYDSDSLQAGPSVAGTLGATAVQTLAGALWRAGAQSQPCPATDESCVLRLSVSGALSDPYPTQQPGVLVGPYPALVQAADSSGGNLVLIRLS